MATPVAPQPMDSEPYTDGPVSEQQPEGDEMSSEKDKDADASTAIVPKAALHGKDVSVGDEVTFKITRMGENDVEVVCVDEYGEKSEPPGEDTGAEAGAQPPDSMGSMLE